jgi:hypothetical protein
VRPKGCCGCWAGVRDSSGHKKMIPNLWSQDGSGGGGAGPGMVWRWFGAGEGRPVVGLAGR